MGLIFTVKAIFFQYSCIEGGVSVLKEFSCHALPYRLQNLIHEIPSKNKELYPRVNHECLVTSEASWGYTQIREVELNIVLWK